MTDLKMHCRDGIIYYQFPAFESHCRFVHAFIGRRGGRSPDPYASLNIGVLSGDSMDNVHMNLQRIAGVLKVETQGITAARQVHGSQVVRITSDNQKQSLFHSSNPFHADALITDTPGIYLGILTADCLPVLFLDPVKGVAAAAHAGWRGTLANVSAATARAMHTAYGTRMSDLLAALGPSIGPCCYSVGEEVTQAFREQHAGMDLFIHQTGPNGASLDLAGINRKQLLELGLEEHNIFASSLCTKCHCDSFFSVRAEPDPTGRQIALIGIRR